MYSDLHIRHFGHVVLIVILIVSSARATAQTTYESELVFPLHDQHNHAPGIVELANGELLVSWYRGSGERRADDVAIYGARKPAHADRWGEAFLMADTPGFPDCNTCMMIDHRNQLRVFWPVIIANTWESCLTFFKVAEQPEGAGAPTWTERGVILMKPDDFGPEAIRVLDAEIAKLPTELAEAYSTKLTVLRELLTKKLYQRLGWQPRCKPTVLPSGRILLPLYSDTYSISIMAVSDDDGASWYASKPLIGFGNIQPSVLRRDDGTLVAYMRENGPRQHIRVCRSRDDGITWGPVTESVLPNPGSGLDGVRLQNGHWLLVYNDTLNGRNSLAVSVSADEGRSWKWTRHLENEADGAYHYPAVIQGGDGRIHTVYSFFVEGGKSMKHAAFDEAWVKQGDPD